MNTEEQAQQKAISTPTIITLVVGLAVLGYLLLQPLFAPKEQAAVSSAPAVAASQPATSSTGTASSVPVSTGTKEASDQTEQALNLSGVSDRDPFLPSTIMLTKGPQTVKTEPVAPSIEPSKPEKPSTPPQEVPLSWKGVVGSGPNQVVMIRRNNRTYTLHLGDVVSGTEYILAEISKDSVLLISPQGQKRLFRKKEVK
jgi:type II secretory pathway component PulC